MVKGDLEEVFDMGFKGELGVKSKVGDWWGEGSAVTRESDAG